MNINLSISKFIKILSSVAFILIVLSILGHIYIYKTSDDRYLVHMFDMDREWNVPTIFSAINLLIVGVLLQFIATIKRQNKEPFVLHWRFLAILFLYVSFDEILVLHEQTITPLRSLMNTSGIFYFAWTIPASFFVVFLSVIYLKFIIKIGRPIRFLMILSAIIYISGSIGGELVSGWFLSENNETSLLYLLITDIEESLELTGIILFIRALLLYIKRENNVIQFKICN